METPAQSPMPDLPPPPRRMTPFASWRAWSEPSVRVWWLMAGAVLVMIGIHAVDRLWSRHVEGQLIADGVPLTAKVVSAGQHATPGQTADPGEVTRVTVAWHDAPLQLTGTLTKPAFIGSAVPIRVDPNDPTRWTDQTVAAPVLNALFVGLLLLPIVPLLLLVALWKRQRIAATWRTGSVESAVVADRRQTPLAPFSYAVRCSLADGGRRLHTVYVPRAGRGLSKGDAIPIAVPTGRGRPVSVQWFTDQ